MLGGWLAVAGVGRRVGCLVPCDELSEEESGKKGSQGQTAEKSACCGITVG